MFIENNNFRIGRYRLESKLGQGGMGVVYKAVNVDTGDMVALKTVHVPHVKLLQSIRREIHTLRSLSHPGVVQVKDSGIIDGIPWYTMTLLEGKTLHDEILDIHGIALSQDLPEGAGNESDGNSDTADTLQYRSFDLLSYSRDNPHQNVQVRDADISIATTELIRRSCFLFHRLCQTLSYLHNQGIVHRDIKPENVFLDDNEHPVLVDFGLIAQFDEIAGRENLFVEDSIVGTANYMSPEQIRGELVDARADLYSLGCLFYEFLTGYPPFFSNSASQIIRAHLFEEPLQPVFLQSFIPEELNSLLMRLLAKNPRERMGYATDVMAFLEKYEPSIQKTRTIESPKIYLYRPGFTGRDSIVHQLQSYRQDFLGGQGRIVYIRGESGVGKTRLALEFARGVAAEDTLVLSGKCPEHHRKPLTVFNPIFQFIADRCHNGGIAETEKLLGKRVRVLSQYEPALISVPGYHHYEQPESLAPQAAQIRLYSYLLDVLSVLSLEKPLMFVLDDMQWADELTLGFISFLINGRCCNDWPILLLCLYRQDEADFPLIEHTDKNSVEIITVDRLNDKEIAQLVRDVLSISYLPQRFSKFLARFSRGNPYFVTEYLRAAVEENVIWRDSEGNWQVAGESDGYAREADFEKIQIPRSLHALVNRRLSVLSTQARFCCEFLAVCERDIPLDSIHKVMDLAEQHFFRSLDELVQRAIIEQDNEGNVYFSHEKVRELVYGSISEKIRRAYHKSVAEYLSEGLTQYQNRGAVIAYHWEKAGFPDKAKPLYLAAAQLALEQYAMHEAGKLFQSYFALNTKPGKESVKARDRYIMEVLFHLGKTGQAIEECRLNIEDAITLEEIDCEADCRLSLAYCLQLAGNINESFTEIDKADTLYQKTGNKLGELHSLQIRASLTKFRGKLEEAEQYFLKAHDMYETLGAYDKVNLLKNNLAGLYFQRGDIEKAAKLQEEALLYYQNSKSLREQALILGNMAGIEHSRGNLLKTQEYYEKSLQICREIDDRVNEASALLNLGILYFESGIIDNAETSIEYARDMHRQIGHKRYIAIDNLFLASIQRRTGDINAVRDTLTEAEEFLNSLGDPFYTIICLCEQGFLELAYHRSAMSIINKLEVLIDESGQTEGSEAYKAYKRLVKAEESFRNKNEDRLFRGECIEDIPENIRKWLRNNKLLHAADD